MTDKPNRTLAAVRKEAETKYNTKHQTYADFPVGTRVQVVVPFVDFAFFNQKETGKVIRNDGRYLGIIVKFDKKYERPAWNFEPQDLISLSNKCLNCNGTGVDPLIRKPKLKKC